LPSPRIVDWYKIISIVKYFLEVFLLIIIFARSIFGRSFIVKEIHEKKGKNNKHKQKQKMEEDNHLKIHAKGIFISDFSYLVIKHSSIV